MCSVWRSCGRIRGAPDCTGGGFGEGALWREPARGSAGTWAGMYLFRHKTKHWYFVAGMPLILVCQAALAIYLVHLYVL